MKLSLNSMNPREKIMVIGGGAMAVIILLWALVIDPTVKGRVELAGKIETKKDEIVQTRQTAAKISLARLRFGALERRMPASGGPSLLSVMEGVTISSGVNENVASMEPQPPADVEGYTESSIAMRIEKIPLSGLVALLGQTTGQKTYIRLKRITIKPLYENPDLLDVALTVSWYERK